MAPDHPNRKAGDIFASVVADRRDCVDPPYTYYELATPIIFNGEPLNHRTLRAFLARRGYEKLPPSQKRYRGVSIYTRHRTETHFACGHDRVEENSYYNSRGFDVCRICHLELVRAGHQKRRANRNDFTKLQKSTGPDSRMQNTYPNALGDPEILQDSKTKSFLKKVSVVLESGNLEDLFFEPQEDSVEFTAVEGHLHTILRSVRQRNQKLRQRKLDSVEREGAPIACEVCGFDYGAFYGDRDNGYIEVHHIIPLHLSGPVETKLCDLVLLCANCHRMIHRGPTMVTVEDLRNYIKK